MKKISYLFVLLGASLFFACSDDSTNIDSVSERDEMFETIKMMDDSLNVLFKKTLEEKDFQIDRLVYHESINRNLSFYKKFKSDEFAPYALEKAASMYMALNIEKEAAKWRDSLINNYPDFERILDMLELQKTYYDIDEYNPERMKEYINIMLEHSEKLRPEKIQKLNFRLEHIDKTFDELIEMQLNNLEN